MGRYESDYVHKVLATHLPIREEPTAAVHPRFCSPTTVTLHFKTLSTPDTFCVRDVHTKKVVFRVRERTLFDAQGMPIVNFRLNAVTANYAMFAGDRCRVKLFQIPEVSTKMALTNAVMGRRSSVGFAGLWAYRTGFLLLDTSLRGTPEAIDKVYPPPPKEIDRVPENKYCSEFYVSFSPSVDTALMMLICAKMFESVEMNDLEQLVTTGVAPRVYSRALTGTRKGQDRYQAGADQRQIRRKVSGCVLEANRFHVCIVVGNATVKEVESLANRDHAEPAEPDVAHSDGLRLRNECGALVTTSKPPLHIDSEDHVMDNEHSSPALDVTLVPQAHPVAAIDPRFCKLRAVTLQKYAHFFHSHHTIQDASTGETKFEVKAKILSGRYWIYDANKTPVANYIGDINRHCETTQTVRAGSELNRKELFRLHAQANTRAGGSARVLFKELETGQRCEVAFEGDWYGRNAIFWLDRGRRGVREPVAKIYCPLNASRSSYHIDIVPNMDQALITMLCVLLEDLETKDA